MFKVKGKRVMAVVMVLMLTVCIMSVSAASSNLVNLKAYTGMKIFYNGRELAAGNQPYLINDSTYIPLRMLMDNFGDKDVQWSAANPNQVIVNDKAGMSYTELQRKITEKDQQIASLQKQVDDLKKQLSDKNASLPTISTEISNAFKNEGDEYFDDDISITVKLTGDDDAIVYNITLDFDDADDFDDLSKFNTDSEKNLIKDLMEDVEDKVEDEVEDTDYEDAKITGKLVDADHTSYYVTKNGSTYNFHYTGSGSDDSSGDLGDIADELNDAFDDDTIDDTLNDSGITGNITVTGSESSVSVKVALDFSDADDRTSLSKYSGNTLKTYVKNLVKDIYDEYIDKVEGTDYEDADVVVRVYDKNSSGIYYQYDGSTYKSSF